MAEKLLLQPPESVDLDANEKVIFLAGPIQGAPDWQTQAIEIIHGLDTGIVIASPRKEYAPGEFVYEKQVDWETKYLNRAAQNGCVLFWLAARAEDTPGRAYGQTSRFELGEWKAKNESDASIQLVVGAEPDFGNVRYISRRFKQDLPETPIYDTLEATCLSAIEQALTSVSP